MKVSYKMKEMFLGERELARCEMRVNPNMTLFSRKAKDELFDVGRH